MLEHLETIAEADETIHTSYSDMQIGTAPYYPRTTRYHFRVPESPLITGPMDILLLSVGVILPYTVLSQPCASIRYTSYQWGSLAL